MAIRETTLSLVHPKIQQKGIKEVLLVFLKLPEYIATLTSLLGAY